MKAAKITVAGTTYFLVMDGEAMFTIRDIYGGTRLRSEEHTSELQSRFDLVCRLLLEKKKTIKQKKIV